MDDGMNAAMNQTERALLQALGESGAALHDAIAPIESGFQRAGEELVRAVGALQRITGSSVELSRQMAEDTLAGSTARLQTAASHISALSGKTGTAQASLGSLVTLTNGVEERITRLCRTIAEAKILGINAKIEASHVTARDVDFTVFTREIGRLAELAEASLTKLAVELASLGGQIESARAGQEQFERENQQSLTAVVRRLEVNLQKIGDRQKAATQASAVLAERSQVITGHVSKVVADLQIADITRQRVEHVVHGLEVVRTLFSPPSQDEAADGLQRLHVAAEICGLEGAQLRNAESDFSREVAQIIETLKALAVEAEGIRRQAQAVFGAAGGSETSFFGELGHDLDEVCALLDKYSQAHGRVEAVINAVSAGVAEMVQYLSAVHSIEADMRVMGLNATLKCSRLGKEGRALSVIAQELRAVANRTADDGLVIMKGLESLIAASKGLTSESLAEKGDGQGEVGALSGEMRDAVQILSTANQEVSGMVASLEDDCRTISDALEETVRRVSAPAGSAALLRRVLSRLEEQSRAGGGHGDVDPQAVKERVLAMIKGRYTMAREHEIHALFDGVDGAVPAETGASSSDVDDCMF